MLLYVPKPTESDPIPEIKFTGSPRLRAFVEEEIVRKTFVEACGDHQPLPGLPMEMERKSHIKDQMPTVPPDSIKNNMDGKRILVSQVVKRYVLLAKNVQRDHWGNECMKPPFWPSDVAFRSPNTCRNRTAPGLKGEELTRILENYVAWRSETCTINPTRDENDERFSDEGDTDQPFEMPQSTSHDVLLTDGKTITTPCDIIISTKQSYMQNLPYSNVQDAMSNNNLPVYITSTDTVECTFPHSSNKCRSNILNIPSIDISVYVSLSASEQSVASILPLASIQTDNPVLSNRSIKNKFDHNLKPSCPENTMVFVTSLIETNYDEISCEIFLSAMCTLSWTTIQKTVNFLFPKLPAASITLASDYPRAESLAEFADGQFLKEYVIPVKTDGTKNECLYNSLCLCLWGTQSQPAFLRLCTVVCGVASIDNITEEVMALCQSENDVMAWVQSVTTDVVYESTRMLEGRNLVKEVTKGELLKIMDEQSDCGELQLHLLSRYLNRSIHLYTNSQSAVYDCHVLYGPEYEDKSTPINLLRVPAILPPPDGHIRFSHFVPLLKLAGIQQLKEKCGAEQFDLCLKNKGDNWVCCSKCYQWYHDGCIGVNADFARSTTFNCGCHELKPYSCRDQMFYKDVEEVKNVMRKVQFKSILSQLHNKERNSWREMTLKVTKGQIQREALMPYNTSQLFPFDVYYELSQEIQSFLKGVDQTLLLDVYFPEVVVAVIAYQEKKNRLQSELLIRDVKWEEDSS